MAFADPQSITINAVANSLARIPTGAGVGSFQTVEGNLVETISHAYGKRARHNIRLQTKKLTADPLVPTTNTPVNASVSLTIDVPLQGFTSTEIEQLVTGFLANLTAGTNLNLKKFIGGEA